MPPGYLQYDVQYDAAIATRADEAIRLGRARLAADGVDAVTHFYTGQAYFQRARLRGIRGRLLGAGSDGEQARVHLERALELGERLGGHLVSGHVDCVGQIKTRDTDARSVKLVIGIPLEISRYIAKKGSVCVDGVSLTVNEVSDNSFSVNIIPHTADATIIGDYRSGTEVNIEVDLLARYVERLLGNGDESAITEEYLRVHGYA